MGKYRSDDSDDEYFRKSKRKKKRRSRSSSSSSQFSHISDSRSKKSRKKHRRASRSRSRSADRKRVSRSSRRSRSTSLSRYDSRKRRSDSRSPDRKSSRWSRSPPSKRGKSRSKSPSSRRRRSHSRSRRSRSASRDRRRKSYSRERSLSTDRTSSRSSVDRRKVTGHLAGSSRSKGQSVPDPSPGLSDLTLAEQAEERLRQAMKAATSADERLRALSVLKSMGPDIYSDTKNFAASVSAIESDSFVASSFKSSRSSKIKEEPSDSGMTHDDAIFGSLAISGFTLAPDPDNKPIQIDPDSIMHPSLYCDPQEKMERWVLRLEQLRKRKLEGDVI